MSFPASLWLVGCGNMGGAMLRQWLAAGLSPAAVTVIDPGSPVVAEGVAVVTAPPSAVPEAIVLAVKPQQLDAAAAMVGGIETDLLVSILAGVELATLRDRFAAREIVRAMPNLPVAIGQGVTALYGSDDPRAEALAAPLGLVERITEESLFDAVTALSGCGPGFVFRFIDSLAKAGAALGLPPDQAARLALATVAGSGAMAVGADADPATLADRVASPGGSTREGLNVLDDGAALDALLARTLAASGAKNAELGRAASREA